MEFIWLAFNPELSQNVLNYYD